MIDWNNAVEANAAIDRGELPPGYTLRADGALIVPHLGPRQRLRGSTVIFARFEEIVTTEGERLKRKSGASS